MAPKYILHYFNMTGLGEPIRYLLAYGKEDWEDKRYSDEEWEKAKADMPLGKMPVLEFDGKKLHQSLALTRFAAAKCGLDGKDEFENLQIDIAVDTSYELGEEIAGRNGWFYDPVEVSRTSKYEPLMNKTIPFFMGKLEEMAADNGGYLANGKLSWADIYLIAPLKYYNSVVGFDLLEKHLTLKHLREKVESIPQIAAYILR